MKNKMKYMSGLLMTALAMTACSPDKFDSPVESGKPVVADADYSVSVDQSTNQVTFKLNNKGMYPIWSLPDASPKVNYSTRSELTKIYPNAGTFNYRLQVGNRNGFSDGVITGTFKIDNAILDNEKFLTMLAGDDKKTWWIAKGTKGHVSYGDSGTDGTGEWEADAYSLGDFGVYDDSLTFTRNYQYTFDPDDAGTVYVNKAVSVFPEGPATADYTTAAAKQTTSYNFSVEGNNFFLNLGANSFFPYIGTDEAYNTPKYRIENITPDKIELVSDNGITAWHYVLVSGAEDDSFQGYTANSEFNIFKTADYTMSYYYAPNWSPIADPGFVKKNDNKFVFTLPSATYGQWQSQCTFQTDISTSAEETYDFSVMLQSNKDLGNVTIKLQNDGGAAALLTGTVNLQAYKPVVFYMDEVDGVDIEDLQFLFDFGGNPADTKIIVQNITLQKHGADGVTPPVEDDDNTDWSDADSEDNLLRPLLQGTYDTSDSYYAPGWSQIATPEVSNDNGVIKFTLPEATSESWQAQIKFQHTGVNIAGDQAYDFRLKIVSSTNLPRVAVKVDPHYDNGGNWYVVATDSKTKAYKETWIKVSNVRPTDGMDMEDLQLIFDFGGNPANSEITISDIILQKHKELE